MSFASAVTESVPQSAASVLESLIWMSSSPPAPVIAFASASPVSVSAKALPARFSTSAVMVSPPAPPVAVPAARFATTPEALFAWVTVSVPAPPVSVLVIALERVVVRAAGQVLHVVGDRVSAGRRVRVQAGGDTRGRSRVGRGVGPAAAVQGVGTGPSGERVVPGAARQVVGSVTAVERRRHRARPSHVCQVVGRDADGGDRGGARGRAADNEAAAAADHGVAGVGDVKVDPVAVIVKLVGCAHRVHDQPRAADPNDVPSTSTPNFCTRLLPVSDTQKVSREPVATPSGSQELAAAGPGGVPPASYAPAALNCSTLLPSVVGHEDLAGGGDGDVERVHEGRVAAAVAVERVEEARGDAGHVPALHAVVALVGDIERAAAADVDARGIERRGPAAEPPKAHWKVPAG